MNKENKNGTVLIIFGATGNLVQNKLLPAIYNILKSHNLDIDLEIIFVSRNPKIVKEDILNKLDHQLMESTHQQKKKIRDFIKDRSRVIKLDSAEPEDFLKLKILLEDIDIQKNEKQNHLYYLAIPPAVFKSVVLCLAGVGLNIQNNQAYRRILVEKPFGINLYDAKNLIKFTRKYFNENQIYRIDHYLAKETVQNILTFRFNNPLISGIWNRKFIDHISITAYESIDIEGRAVFYEGMGALRDIIQSHLLQVMAITMMETPKSMNSSDLHKEKLKLLKSVRRIRTSNLSNLALRGQYRGYRDEVGNNKSNIETYAAVKLSINNNRWRGVPVIIRTGKALESKKTEISLVFKDRKNNINNPNILTIRIQPNEGIDIKLLAKKPGLNFELETVDMDFLYKNTFKITQPDAYERVIVDAINGDPSLFATSNEVVECWNILQPVLSVWNLNDEGLYIYPKGSAGPSDESFSNY